MKLPALLSPKMIIKVIEKKEFVPDRVKGSHQIYFHPETRQRVVIPVREQKWAGNIKL